MKWETNVQRIQTPKGVKRNKQQRKLKIPTTITNEMLKKLSKEQIHYHPARVSQVAHKIWSRCSKAPISDAEESQSSVWGTLFDKEASLS